MRPGPAANPGGRARRPGDGIPLLRAWPSWTILLTATALLAAPALPGPGGLSATAGLAAQARADATDAMGVESAGWLAGCWVARVGGGTTREVWMAPEGDMMVGMSRTVREGRAPGWEHLLLAPRNGVLTYTALPSGQALTHFPLARAGPGMLRFENPDHDFPRALEYRRAGGPGADSVHARVFGAVTDVEPAFVLRYAREACPGP